MNRGFFSWMVVCVALGGLGVVGCSDTPATPADSGTSDIGDVPSSDTAPDGASDASADSASDASNDVAADRGVDAQMDVASDVAADVATDVASDVAADVASDAAQSDSGVAARCTASGGTVSTQLCCGSASDFPNTCAIGACGCAPMSSRMVMVCNCPTGRCFNGTECTPM